MSKIVVNFDSETKELSCSIDGAEVEVSDISIYRSKYDGEQYVDLYIGVESEEVGKGLKKLTRIVTANTKNKSIAKISKGSLNHDGTLIKFTDEKEYNIASATYDLLNKR